jgi:hypothetical protein
MLFLKILSLFRGEKKFGASPEGEQKKLQNEPTLSLNGSKLTEIDCLAICPQSF